ncbi:putative GTPase IMAP family member 1 [Melia azedarach]|uniref:GTPase IMAP family member 1 n=1 Tax=Melia azedarach TaxID=155640 RepID=A0ACC1YIG0_MELAZ|nr:putative GTPase IMAP family member 1 [Melia azedarach]
MDAAAEVVDWPNVVMGFCFTSAVEIAKAKSDLSPSYYPLSFAILLTFLCLFVAKLIAQKFIFASQVLQKVAIFVAATAFVFATTIPFPLPLKCATWALYAVSLLFTAICFFN